MTRIPSKCTGEKLTKLYRTLWSGKVGRVVALQPRVWALLKRSWGDQQRIPAPIKVMICSKRRGGQC